MWLQLLILLVEQSGVATLRAVWFMLSLLISIQTASGTLCVHGTRSCLRYYRSTLKCALF